MALQGTWRKRILQFHGLLGLITGVAVFLIAMTGAAWAFKDEIENFNAPYKKVIPQGNYEISPTKAKEIALEIFPDKEVHGTLFGSLDECVEVIFYEEFPEFYRSVYINPYTLEVLHFKDHLSGFFAFILRGHMYLWLPKEIGGFIVKYSILIFLFIIISGLILWIPKKGVKARKQRLTFDWKSTTKWKRKNFDLHTVIGFYIYVFSFVFAFTGTVISFPWFYYIVYQSVGGDNNPRFVIPDNHTCNTAILDEDTLPIDRLIPLLRQKHPLAQTYELHYPHSDTSNIYVELENKKGVFYDNDYRFYDQNTLEEIPSNSIYAVYKEADFGDMVIRMNYDIHIGSIGGLFGKIIAFIASLIIASMPVTGALLWKGRKFKK